jgi:hypothetical protein
MHVVDARAACAFVQVIDVLRAEVKAIAHVLFQRGQSVVGCIGFGRQGVAPAHGIEIPYERWVSFPGFRSCYLLYPVAIP